MHNSEDRVNFWSQHYKKECQGNTSILPISILQDICYQKDVLEIGPGEGRQYKHINNFSDTYAIADISNVVLNLTMYSSVNKHLLISYHQELPQQFDVVHAWFVLHHVLHEETKDFFEFVRRHLRDDGLFCFNISLQQSRQFHGEDGKKTTSRTEDDFDKFLQEQKCKILYKQYIDQKSLVYIISWATDRMFKLNIGGGCYWRMENWINIEKSRNVDDAILAYFQENSISTVYCSHMLEHLPTHQVIHSVLKSIYNLLCDDGLVRIVIPSVNAISKLLRYPDKEELLRQSAKYYQKHHVSFTSHILDLIGFSRSDHQVMLSAEILHVLLFLIGYSNIRFVGYKKGVFGFLDKDVQVNEKGFPITGFDSADHQLISEYIEAVK